MWGIEQATTPGTHLSPSGLMLKAPVQERHLELAPGSSVHLYAQLTREDLFAPQLVPREQQQVTSLEHSSFKQKTISDKMTF